MTIVNWLLLFWCFNILMTGIYGYCNCILRTIPWNLQYHQIFYCHVSGCSCLYLCHGNQHNIVPIKHNVSILLFFSCEKLIKCFNSTVYFFPYWTDFLLDILTSYVTTYWKLATRFCGVKMLTRKQTNWKGSLIVYRGGGGIKFCYLIFGTNPTLFGIPFHSQKSNSACWCWLCNWNAKLKKPQTINGCTFTLSPHNSNTKYQKIFFM